MVSHLIAGNSKPKPTVQKLKNSNEPGCYTQFKGIYDNGETSSRNSKFYIGSYAAIFTLTAIVSLVLLIPLLNRINSIAFCKINSKEILCGNSCRFELVETIPEGITYNNILNHSLTFDVWKSFIENAKNSIEIASFYWTIRENETFPDPSSRKGEEIYQALLDAGLRRNVTIKIAQNEPSSFQPNPDTEYLQKIKAAQVRSVDFNKLIGAGVLHTKFWIVDRKHIYIGSANIDWRALTQVQELGAVIRDCPCVAEDLGKIFDVYWILGNTDKLPEKWSDSLVTKYNANSPLNVSLNNETNLMYFSSSPPQLSPKGRNSDLDALLRTIANADKFIYIAVMDYLPLILFQKSETFWPLIDNEIRRAVIDRNVNVRILISQWRSTRPMMYNFMNSLKSLNQFNKKVIVEVKKFKLKNTPTQQQIPFARVNHNKFMVTDKTVFIGTSNWSGDYFVSTSGTSLVIFGNSTIQKQLLEIFERNWNSEYALPIF